MRNGSNQVDRFRVIADSLPVLVSYVQPDFRYAWANRTYERWFGHPPGWVAGRHVRDVLGASAWDRVRPLMERALAGEVVTYEAELPYLETEPRWVRVTYTPDRVDGVVRGFTVLVADVGEQKAAERRLQALTAELRASVDELQSFFRLLPIGIFIAHDPECSVITTNAAGAALLGTEPGRNPSKTGPDAGSLPFRVLVDGVEPASEDLPMQRAARANAPVLGQELEIVRDDGSRASVWVYAMPIHDPAGHVRGSLGAFVETVARRGAAEEEAEGDAVYRALFELASVGAAEADVRTGQFLKVNRRLCEITGYTEEQLLARTFSDITHPDDRERDAAQWYAALESGSAFQHEKRYVRPDGRIVWVVVTGRAIPSARGVPRSFAHAIDITDRKNVEARDALLVRLDDAMRRLDDPDAITRAAATMLGEALGADRCACAAVDLDQDSVRIVDGYRRDLERPAPAATLRLSDLGDEGLARMRAGAVHVVPDTESVAWGAALGLGALVCVPLHDRELADGGVLVAIMIAGSAAPRRWWPEEIELVRAVARRCADGRERARVRRALEESEASLRRFVETANEGIVRVDADDRIVWANDYQARLVGCSPRELAGTHILDFVFPEDRERIARGRRERREGRGERYELRLRARDGREVWVLNNTVVVQREGRYDGTYTMMADITEQRRAQEALRTSEERLRLALQGGDLGDWSWDASSDVVTLGARTAEVFGVAPSTAMTWTEMRALLDPAHAETARLAVVAALASRTEYALEYRIRRPSDDRYLWVSAHGRGTYGEDGRPTGMVGVVQDVTSRKAAEAERELLLARERTAREEAERAGRLKDEFLATVSHELRTPLNAILGWAQLLESGTLKGEDAVEQAIAVIQRNARAQSQIIDDLLDMSRIISGKVRLELRPVELAEVVAAALETVRPAAQAKHLTLESRVDPRAGMVRGDASRLQQVVWNLLSNAVKFTPSGGRVELSLASADGWVEIVVRDSGIGISPEFLPYVFDRFRQAEGGASRRYAGLGLGLAIVRQIVELHGGEVRARSAGEGLGAELGVRLPLLRADEAVAPGADVGEPSARRGDATRLEGLAVLVVDDDLDGRELVRHVLSSRGARVACAASALEALAALEAERPDILVSDLGMPDVDGYELMRRVRARGERVPAIALTAFASSQDRRRALMAGYDMHVPKPVDGSELVAAVARLTGKAARGSG